MPKNNLYNNNEIVEAVLWHVDGTVVDDDDRLVRRGIPREGKLAWRTDTKVAEVCVDEEPDPAYDGGGTWEPLGFAGGVVTQDTFQLVGSVSNPTLGAGGLGRRRWVRFGPLIWCEWAWSFGGAGNAPGSGTYRFENPVEAQGPMSGGVTAPTGSFYLYHLDVTLQNTIVGVASVGVVYTEVLYPQSTSGTLFPVRHNEPYLWDDGSYLHGSAWYVAA